VRLSVLLRAVDVEGIQQVRPRWNSIELYLELLTLSEYHRSWNVAVRTSDG